MITKHVNDYINQAYSRWMDYAQFQAARANIPDQGGDILNTVLESLLRKDPKDLQDLFEKKKQGYTELDFFILRMIKLNAHSPTSPYRHKNRGLPRDANQDPWRMEILDEEPEAESYSERVLRLMRLSREMLAGLDIQQLDRDIFTWKFYGGFPLKSWPGEESYTYLCASYNRVLEQMRRAVSPEKYQVRMFCRTFVKVRSKLLRAA